MTTKITQRKAELNNEILLAKQALTENINNIDVLWNNSKGTSSKSSPFNAISLISNFVPKSSFLGKMLGYYKVIMRLFF